MKHEVRGWPDAETRLAAALFGFALGVVLLPFWTQPPPPGQVAGYAVTALHIDGRAPFRFIVALSLLTVAAPILLHPVLRRLASGRAWARHAVAMAAFVSLWSAFLDRSFWRSVLPFAIALAVVTPLRNLDFRFSRRDLILVPGAFAIAIALIDVAYFMTVQTDLIVATAAVLAIRVILLFIPPRDVDPAASFALAPLALLFESELLTDHQRHLGWPVLAIALVTPFILRPLIRDARPWRKVIGWIIYPLAIYGFTLSTTISSAEGKPRASFFEEQHGLVPVEQMLHGKKPWRDFVPAHGLVEDGLLDYLALAPRRNPTVGHAMRVRTIVSNLTAVATYTLGAVATGSAEAGFFAWFLSMLYGSATMPVRVVPALFALACTILAARRRKPRWFAVAGFLLVIALFTGVEFAFYSAIVFVVALVRYGADRMRALREASIGIAIASVPIFLALVFTGLLRDFLRTTFVEVPAMAPAYAIDIFQAPEAFDRFQHIPDAVLLLIDKEVFHYVLWPILAIFAGMTLAARRRRAIEPMALLAVWAMAASLSYAERHHMYFDFVVGPFLAAVAWLMFRLHSRWAPVVVVTLIAIGNPTGMFAGIGFLRRAHWPLEPRVEIQEPARARGVLWVPYYAGTIVSVKRYVDASLRPGDTFFDFTNRGILYFLFDRDCPVRQTEVAYYEPVARQREVIAAIDRNPHVVAALVPPPAGDRTGVDNVANPIRAPLVWRYLQTHFHPEFQDGPVVFWRRNGAVVASSR